MPRIMPRQLLNCLSVLLNDTGGILSSAEVPRIAGLMTKYSKKLVSKCIYVQILKCTQTELLDEFMSLSGWSLVYTWLNDAIRAMNWPLVQEVLELLLLCPVDVHRLKLNTAPKLVKGLCKEGGNEGVRILAKRLVDQWLKVVTEDSALQKQQQQQLLQQQQQQQQQTMAPRVVVGPVTVPPVKVVLPAAKPDAPTTAACPQNLLVNKTITPSSAVQAEQDPLAVVSDNAAALSSNGFPLTQAQKKASESGLVYKIIVKNGKQMLTKVAKPTTATVEIQDDDDDAAAESIIVEESESVDGDDEEFNASNLIEEDDGEEDDTKNSTEMSAEKQECSNGAAASSEEDSKSAAEKSSEKKKDDKDRKKETSSSRRSSTEKSKDRSSNSNSVSKSSDKDRDHKSSSSSSHRSSSSGGHKSSSKSSSSSSSSKSKSSSSSSSSHRSSSDKHRSSSSSGRDKDRSSSSSSSSKHRSSSSKSSSSSSSKDRHRDRDKSSSSSSKREKEPLSQSEKDKETLAKLTNTPLDKSTKIPKKPKGESTTSPEGTPNEARKSPPTIGPTSITIPSKKASMSIEIRRDVEKAKTVKTYKSQFRSHGLDEEAPPPPSRKGLKKPSASTPTPGSIIPASLPSSLKRTSPPPAGVPSEKKAKIDLINNVSVANEKPGAIKLIPPKKIQTLVETNIFSDALSASTVQKKNKRKRLSAGKDGASPPTSPEAVKMAPLKFYQDTLDESKTEDSPKDKDAEGKENNAEGLKSPEAEHPASPDKDNDDDDDIPLKKVKEDIEQKVLNAKKSSNSNEEVTEVIEVPSEAEEDDNAAVGEPEEKKPGPGCGPNGPPGVLMLHRRKGPKKKLTWRPQENLEQVRYFEVDETERVNVTKTSSFMDMQNMERFGERDAIKQSRHIPRDNMKESIEYGNLKIVDDVTPHPNGNMSKQRAIQAAREAATLKALYFTASTIPFSPAEPELEVIFPHDVPIIPLEDVTGNPDAVSDHSNMPWPEGKLGSPQRDDNAFAGTGGLGDMGVAPGDIFGTRPMPTGNQHQTPFGPRGPNFMNSFGPSAGNMGPVPNPPQIPMPGMHGGNMVGGVWQSANMGPMMNNGMMGSPFNGHMDSPNMDMCPNGMMGPNGGGPQNFMGSVGGFHGTGPFGPFGGNGGGPNFNPMMNGPGPNQMNGPMNHRNGGGGGGNRNNGNWRNNGNFNDGPNGGSGGGNWRPAGSGPNRGNNGVCKAFVRGHCRLGKNCKFIHTKNKRI